MTIKAIHVAAVIYPDGVEGTQALAEEVRCAREFANAIEEYAKTFLRGASHKITITEERATEIRGGR